MSSPLISAAELLARLENFVILDVRTGANAEASFAEGHLPGARFVDLDHDLASHGDPSKGGRHPLPSLEEFSATLGRLGVGRDDEVVVYDLASGSNPASRLWWMLRAIGHTKVRVLEGTRPLWESAGLSFVATKSDWEARPPYPCRSYTLPLADFDEVDSRRLDGKSLVVDARSAPRYRGEVEPIDPIAGHIPGAANLFHMSLVDDEGRMLDKDALVSSIKAVIGERPIDEVIVHCGSGVTACHLILAMDQAELGIPKLYVGSWSEWCRRDATRAQAPQA